jgi:hypothetical protein
VSAASFTRPASVRLERGRTDPDALYELALDAGALVREVLAPLGPGGDGRYLPSLWDIDRDRATRAGYATADPTTVLVVDGSLLLRPPVTDAVDLAVHLQLSAGALARRTPEADRWTLPAYERYADEDRPAATADVVVRADDPQHPAVVVTERRRRRAEARGTEPGSRSR